MPSSSASAQPCSGPAPPNGTSVNARGSRPRSTETTRIAPTMLLSAIARMPRAAATQVEPERLGHLAPHGVLGQRRGRAACARRAARPAGARARHARRSRSRPCRRRRSRRGPEPPRRWPARPSARRPGARAIEPPPAPTVTMSTIGSGSGHAPTLAALGQPDAAVLDQADVGAGAADVDGDEVGDAAGRPPRRARRPRPPPGPTARSAPGRGGSSPPRRRRRWTASAAAAPRSRPPAAALPAGDT